MGTAYTQFFGSTTSPEATLFKKLSEQWTSLDLADWRLPDIPPSLKKQSDSLLEFIEERLRDPNSLPRCDYKEFLALAKLYLGGTVSRKKG